MWSRHKAVQLLISDRKNKPGWLSLADQLADKLCTSPSTNVHHCNIQPDTWTAQSETLSGGSETYLYASIPYHFTAVAARCSDLERLFGILTIRFIEMTAHIMIPNSASRYTFCTYQHTDSTFQNSNCVSCFTSYACQVFTLNVLLKWQYIANSYSVHHPISVIKNVGWVIFFENYVCNLRQ